MRSVTVYSRLAILFNDISESQMWRLFFIVIFWSCKIKTTKIVFIHILCTKSETIFGRNVKVRIDGDGWWSNHRRFGKAAACDWRTSIRTRMGYILYLGDGREIKRKRERHTKPKMVCETQRYNICVYIVWLHKRKTVALNDEWIFLFFLIVRKLFCNCWSHTYFLITLFVRTMDTWDRQEHCTVEWCCSLLSLAEE